MYDCVLILGECFVLFFLGLFQSLVVVGWVVAVACVWCLPWCVNGVFCILLVRHDSVCNECDVLKRNRLRRRKSSAFHTRASPTSSKHRLSTFVIDPQILRVWQQLATERDSSRSRSTGKGTLTHTHTSDLTKEQQKTDTDNPSHHVVARAVEFLRCVECYVTRCCDVMRLSNM